jgi:hypothetical protein
MLAGHGGLRVIAIIVPLRRRQGNKRGLLDVLAIGAVHLPSISESAHITSDV